MEQRAFRRVGYVLLVCVHKMHVYIRLLCFTATPDIYMYVIFTAMYMYLQNMYVYALHILPISQHWSKLHISGKKPPARSSHTACCLSGTVNHPFLIVVGGWDGTCVFSDVWLLDVADGSWSEVYYIHACT